MGLAWRVHAWLQILDRNCWESRTSSLNPASTTRLSDWSSPSQGTGRVSGCYSRSQVPTLETKTNILKLITVSKKSTFQPNLGDRNSLRKEQQSHTPLQNEYWIIMAVKSVPGPGGFSWKAVSRCSRILVSFVGGFKICSIESPFALWLQKLRTENDWFVSNRFVLRTRSLRSDGKPRSTVCYSRCQIVADNYKVHSFMEVTTAKH